jgi:acyl carrier protein
MITQEQLNTDLETILELDSGTLKGDERLENINWDSLSVISFIAHADGSYGISVPASKLHSVETVAGLLELVNGLSK